MAEFTEAMNRLSGQIRAAHSYGGGGSVNTVHYGGNGCSASAGGGGGGGGAVYAGNGYGGGSSSADYLHTLVARGMMTVAEAREQAFGIEVTAIGSPRREFLPAGIPCSYCRTLGTGQQCWWCGAPRRA